MSTTKKTYSMCEIVWLYPGMAAWHFVNVSKKASQEIKEKYGRGRPGFGSIPVKVTVGTTTWETSIFPDSKVGAYLLPIKAAVRKKERIFPNTKLSYSFEVRL